MIQVGEESRAAYTKELAVIVPKIQNKIKQKTV